MVKGKTKPVSIYEVVDYHTDDTFPNMIEVLGYFKDGIEHYQSGKFDPAMKSFKEALKLNPEDKTSSMYVERCKTLKAKPPKGKWEGVWVMTSK